MTSIDFADSIPNFSKLNFSEKIQRFCWHLTVNQGKATFTGKDVKRCFDETGCSVPSSFGPFLTSLINQGNPFLRKNGTAYRLTRFGEEKFASLKVKRDSTVKVDNLLSELPSKLPEVNERVFLEEALICFRNKAFRAAIVMTWNLTFDHLCNVILSQNLAAFNTQLPLNFPKAKILSIAHRDDFDVLKESEVLKVAKSAKIITGNVEKVLLEKLDRRNIAAHPSSIVVTQLTAEEVIHDLITNVVLKI